jgi:hypothetical protein
MAKIPFAKNLPCSAKPFFLAGSSHTACMKSMTGLFLSTHLGVEIIH